MGKRLIFTEEESNVGSEIEMFLNDKGNVSVVVKYENDDLSEIRCIQLSIDDFKEMVSIVQYEIRQINE